MKNLKLFKLNESSFLTNIIKDIPNNILNTLHDKLNLKHDTKFYKKADFSTILKYADKGDRTLITSNDNDITALIFEKDIINGTFKIRGFLKGEWTSIEDITITTINGVPNKTNYIEEKFKLKNFNCYLLKDSKAIRSTKLDKLTTIMDLEEFIEGSLRIKSALKIVGEKKLKEAQSILNDLNLSKEVNKEISRVANKGSRRIQFSNVNLIFEKVKLLFSESVNLKNEEVDSNIITYYILNHDEIRQIANINTTKPEIRLINNWSIDKNYRTEFKSIAKVLLSYISKDKLENTIIHALTLKSIPEIKHIVKSDEYGLF